MKLTKHIKAFTVFELLITMTLTVILVAFSYSGFSMMQKLFTDYTKQSNFISEINQLHTALFYLSDKATTIQKKDDKTLVFQSDSASTFLTMNDNAILLTFTSHTDTFHVEPKNTTFKLLTLTNQLPSTLIEKFDSDVFYKTQKFHLSFQKEYDAQHILKSTLEIQPLDEFN